MVKANFDYVCDWCEEPIKGDRYKIEYEGSKKKHNDDGLDCCKDCYEDKIAPRNFAEPSRGYRSAS